MATRKTASVFWDFCSRTRPVGRVQSATQSSAASQLSYLLNINLLTTLKIVRCRADADSDDTDVSESSPGRPRYARIVRDVRGDWMKPLRKNVELESVLVYRSKIGEGVEDQSDRFLSDEGVWTRAVSCQCPVS